MEFEREAGSLDSLSFEPGAGQLDLNRSHGD